jgi:hypothetical protein
MNPQPKKVGDGLFQACFAWCSSGGSHMGQQADATGCLFFLSRHKKAPSHGNFPHYITKGDEKSSKKPRFPGKCCADFCFTKAGATEAFSKDIYLAFSGKGLYNGRQKEKVAFLYRP